MGVVGKICQTGSKWPSIEAHFIDRVELAYVTSLGQENRAGLVRAMDTLINMRKTTFETLCLGLCHLGTKILC